MLVHQSDHNINDMISSYCVLRNQYHQAIERGDTQSIFEYDRKVSNGFDALVRHSQDERDDASIVAEFMIDSLLDSMSSSPFANSANEHLFTAMVTDFLEHPMSNR